MRFAARAMPGPRAALPDAPTHPRRRHGGAGGQRVGTKPLLLALPLFNAWVKADAATDFCALVDFGLQRTFQSLEPTFLEVCSLRFAVMDLFTAICS